MRKPLKIGNIELKNPFLLAPLAGFTDKTMRALCSQQGASLTFTEMVSAKGLKYGDRKTRKLLELAPGEVAGFQIFGSEPDILAFAAEELAGCGNVILDLNCGCPVPKIVKNGEGSALLKNPDLLYDCVAAMVAGAQRGAGGDSEGNSSPKPVTAKIRMGFELGENVAVEAAKAIEAAGGAAVTVHGRTRQQYYEGPADWQVIAEVKKAVRIPVIGNGDIRCGADALRMMEETGCDGVMIARGALGNPWIFAEAVALWERSGAAGAVSDTGDAEFTSKSSLTESTLKSSPTELISPNADERIDMLIRHIREVCLDKGESIGVKEMRKFVGYYTKGMHGATAVRRRVNSINDAETMISVIRELTR